MPQGGREVRKHGPGARPQLRRPSLCSAAHSVGSHTICLGLWTLPASLSPPESEVEVTGKTKQPEFGVEVVRVSVTLCGAWSPYPDLAHPALFQP